MSTPILLAPGHVYVARLGTGIRWAPGRATLYQGGAVIATAHHTTANPWDFWYDLAFADAFPQVASWWFRAPWTARVRLSRPQGLLDPTTVYGYVQFRDADSAGQLWTLRDAGDSWVVAAPDPPDAVQPINFPLRLALARCIFGILSDDISADTWYDLTSVVDRAQLAAALPTDPAALTALAPRRLGALLAPHPDDDPQPELRPWRLAGVDGGDLRAAWCRLMGLGVGEG